MREDSWLSMLICLKIQTCIFTTSLCVLPLSSFLQLLTLWYVMCLVLKSLWRSRMFCHSALPRRFWPVRSPAENGFYFKPLLSSLKQYKGPVQRAASLPSPLFSHFLWLPKYNLASCELNAVALRWGLSILHKNSVLFKDILSEWVQSGITL